MYDGYQLLGCVWWFTYALLLGLGGEAGVALALFLVRLGCGDGWGLFLVRVTLESSLILDGILGLHNDQKPTNTPTHTLTAT